jgi:hypothetical protein
VVAKAMSSSKAVVASAETRVNELIETCTFVLTPEPEAMR